MKQMLAVTALAVMASPAFAAAGPADLIIRHATVIDVAKGRTMSDQAIAVRGGDIVAVGADRAVSRRVSAKQTVDATGKFVMPGLIGRR